MDSYEMPDADETVEERVLIRWGLVGFVAGLGMVYGFLYYIWQLCLPYVSGA